MLVTCLSAFAGGGGQHQAWARLAPPRHSQADLTDSSAHVPQQRVDGVLFVPGDGRQVPHRQIPEGYWLGPMIGPDDVSWLRDAGVRVVLSAVRPSHATLAALHDAGIDDVGVYMGATFRHARTILDVASRYAPDQIYIHCTHGADRTGAIAAFLLVMKHGWSIADAFYAVVYPDDRNVRGLATALAQMGIHDTRSASDPSVGIYSPHGHDGMGGLKAMNDDYRRMVITTIEAIRRQRGPSQQPSPDAG